MITSFIPSPTIGSMPSPMVAFITFNSHISLFKESPGIQLLQRFKYQAKSKSSTIAILFKIKVNDFCSLFIFK